MCRIAWLQNARPESCVNSYDPFSDATPLPIVVANSIPMKLALDSSQIAIIAALLAFTAVPLALFSISVSMLLFAVSVLVALIKGWQGRQKILGKISLGIALILIILCCVNLFRFFAT